jgi:hypothetical protein
MARVSKSRRAHTKSRNGCIECKQRHIKCDERWPTCVNCDVTLRECYYLERLSVPVKRFPGGCSSTDYAMGRPEGDSIESPDSHSTATDGSTCRDNDELFTLQHLALFHHVETGVTDWLMVTRDLQHLTNAYISSALSTPYLMNQLLALSALHLSTVHHGQIGMYQRLATKLQTRALILFNEVKKNESQQDGVASFLFSSLMAVHILADKLSTNRDDFDRFMGGFIDYIDLHRGARIVGDSSWSTLSTSDLGQWFKTLKETKTPDNALPSDLCDLCTMLKSSSLREESIQACKDATRALAFVHRRLDTPSTWGVHAPMAWATLVSTDYVRLLEKRTPEAIIVLAHYAAVLHRCRDFWVFADGGEYLIRGIYGILGTGWKEWLVTPFRALSCV